MIAYAADGTTLQGMIVDLATAMCNQMGRTIVFKPMALPALMPALEAKSIDIAFTVMNDTPEREQVLDFVDFFNFRHQAAGEEGQPRARREPRDRVWHDGLDRSRLPMTAIAEIRH
jgi:polar amino acid transport system substrate-binding protein